MGDELKSDVPLILTAPEEHGQNEAEDQNASRGNDPSRLNQMGQATIAVFVIQAQPLRVVLVLALIGGVQAGESFPHGFDRAFSAANPRALDRHQFGP